MLNVIDQNPDCKRFKGDNTIGGYSGPLRDLLADVQMALRVELAVTDPFPDAEDFDRAMEDLFTRKAGHMVELGCELKQSDSLNTLDYRV